MRKKQKSLCSVLLSAAMVVSSLTFGVTSEKEIKVVSAQEDTAEEFRDLDSETITAEMGTGWNLGNSMESVYSYDPTSENYMTPGETAWGNPVTTQAMIDKLHDLGFNTVRIPVSWGSMIDDDDDYSIDEDWIGRVKEIVDYCVSKDMYAIINIHHDGASDQDVWLNILKADEDGNFSNGSCKSGDELDALYKKFAGTWKSIATYFKDYDEHLLFEGMNEIGGFYEGASADIQNVEIAIINELNQTFVDTVRATGGNNANRWLIVPSRCTQFASALEDDYDFQMPTDTLESSRLMLAVHYYSSFGVASMTKNFAAFYKKYVSQGIPVILGEYGYTASGAYTAKRAYQYEGTNRLCRQYGIIPVAWDNNGDDYRLLSRASSTLTDANYYVVAGLMRGYHNEGDASEIERDTSYKTTVETTAITSFAVSSSEVTVGVNKKKILTVSNILPEDNNDVVLWKSEDETVATTYGGRIYGKGVGTTTVTAYTWGGEATQTITVTVTATSEEEDDAEPAFQSPLADDDDDNDNSSDNSSDSSSDSSAANTDKKGDTFKVAGQTYQITKVSGSAGTVTYVAPKNKKVKKVTIPNKVTSPNGGTYKVTKVKAKALAGLKKLKKVTIGKNVTSIGKKAFQKDSKLKTIQIKSKKLKSVGKNALKGINKKATIKVPKAKLKKYKKLFRKKGQAKTVKIKK